MDIIIDEYFGILGGISFRYPNAYVNAKDMCGIFKKSPYDYLCMASVQNYIAEFAKSDGECMSDYPVVITKSNEVWFHPDLAIRCARWLDADFGNWCELTVAGIGAGMSDDELPFSETYIEALKALVSAKKEGDS